MYICPVCNGLIDYIKYCPKCGDKMEVLDRVENYYDDYSPYLSYELTDLNDGDVYNKCSHICLCNGCGNRNVVGIRNIIE
jgi:hypothetical protein